jgi:Fatty acid hydroxylase superfamily
MPPASEPAPFRAAYRAGVSRYYSPWLHAGFVFGAGFLFIAWQLSLALGGGALLLLLSWAAGFLVFNTGVYVVHRSLGHRRRWFALLFYQRHTGDHHSFFLDHAMTWDEPRDFRVILFPPWLLVVVSLIALLFAWPWGLVFGPFAQHAFAAAITFGYLTYEAMHLCHHLPSGHPLTKVPFLREVGHLHRLHHRRTLMAGKNFDIVLPVTDLLLGTLYWEKPAGSGK